VSNILDVRSMTSQAQLLGEMIGPMYALTRCSSRLSSSSFFFLCLSDCAHSALADQHGSRSMIRVESKVPGLIQQEKDERS
jgi:hypothetical protein